MKVSLNWIKFIDQKYGCAPEPAPDGVDALVDKIGEQLGAVEEVIDLGQRYKGIAVVKVVSIKAHSNADKLSVCLVDDGGLNKDLPRNEAGYIQIVCGASNVKEGMLAAWIPPGVTVPASAGKEPFIVEIREIRGIESNGMLASARELALGDDHEGILEIDKDLPLGSSFAEAYQLNDYIIDIENKMFTHRPDCFGMLGVAREIAGIQNQIFKSPEWYSVNAPLPKSGNNDLSLVVNNQLPELVPRFSAFAVKDVQVKPSPTWLQARLSSVGIRPINNLVDLSNFYMLETAQPIHIYDYDKVKKLSGGQSAELTIRHPKASEKIEVLGQKELEPPQEAMMVAAGEHLVCVGGIMGGANSEVDEATKNIIIEAATWDMNTIRKTAMELGLFTDAAIRFTKGQSPLQNVVVIAKMLEQINDLTGGKVASELVDDIHLTKEVLDRASLYEPITISADFINSRLGLNLDVEQISSLLRNVEFEVETQAETLKVNAPFWRTDIEIAEDIVEEVGRLHGYKHLPLKLPPRDLKPAEPEALLSFKSRLRSILFSAGANELLTYSFVHSSLLESADHGTDQAYHIRNALSPNLQYYRLSLAPSLLEKVHPNVKLGFERFVLFEIGKAHIKGLDDEENLPAELERLALVFAANSKISGAPYYIAKKYVDFLLDKNLLIKATYLPLNSVDDMPKQWQVAAKAFEPSRSAAVKSGNTVLGLIGEPSIKLRSKLKLPISVAAAELDTTALKQLASNALEYQPLNRYPKLSQDLCLKVAGNFSYGQLTDFISQILQTLTNQHGSTFWIEPLDIFQKPDDVEYKQVTWHITFANPERTLTTQEVNELLEKAAAQAKVQIGAERV